MVNTVKMDLRKTCVNSKISIINFESPRAPFAFFICHSPFKGNCYPRLWVYHSLAFFIGLTKVYYLKQYAILVLTCFLFTIMIDAVCALLRSVCKVWKDRILLSKELLWFNSGLLYFLVNYLTFLYLSILICKIWRISDLPHDVERTECLKIFNRYKLMAGT